LSEHEPSPAPAFADLFDLAEIQRIQDAFAGAMGVASIITTPDGVHITSPSNFSRLCRDVIRKTECGLSSCLRSEAELVVPDSAGPTIRHCLGAGLWEGCAGIFAGDVHMGNWLIGQVRIAGRDESTMIEYAREIGADEREFREALAEVPVVTAERFQEIANALFLTANFMSRIAYQNRQQSAMLGLLGELQEGSADSTDHASRMKSLSQMAGGLAHDFNNLLTGIKGNAELLSLERAAAGQGGDDYREVVEAAERTAGLTGQLLGFSRKGHLHTVNVDLHAVLHDVARVLDLGMDHRIGIELRTEAERSTVHGDPTLLHNAFVNLAVIARDAMPDGGVLTIATRVARPGLEHGHDALFEDDDDEYLEISVMDTGAGLDDPVRRALFNPLFVNAKEERASGLFAVRECIESHDGDFELRARTSEGVDLRIQLPLVPPDEEIVRPGPVAREPVLGAGRILVVDDEEGVRHFAEQALTHLGYTVDVFADGRSAVEHYRAHHADIDLVLLDLIMPGLDGEGTFVLMQEIDPQVRVVVASGFHREKVMDTLLEQGALGFVDKPFGVSDLSREIARHMP
jgi:signal transduction histidine kinase